MPAFVFDAYGTLYDVHSVAAEVEAAFPGKGDAVTQIWRLKQLEYSWLRTAMRRYADFWQVTGEALEYTLDVLGLEADPATVARLAQTYNQLTPYRDTVPALEALAGSPRAIFSNGSPAMLAELVSHSGLRPYLEAVLSVDPARAFKPDPSAYALVVPALGVDPKEVIFVSSNGFDIAGAKAFGFKVARIERVSAAVMRDQIAADPDLGPASMYKALRTQSEVLGEQADWTVSSLTDLARLA